MKRTDAPYGVSEPRPGDQIKPLHYRKKPVVIDALRWSGHNLRQVIDFTGLHPSANKWTWEEYEDVVKKDGLKIFSLEGPHLASVGDWIIRGVKGEFYACKPDIFAMTYESAVSEKQEPTNKESLSVAAEPCCREYTTCHKPCTVRGAYLERAGVYRNEAFTVQRAPTQAGERETLAADQVQANAPESAHPERRTAQVAYPGIDKRKVRGETPRTDAEIEHPQNILIENAQAERRGDKCSYQVVRADFARQLEREAAFYKLAATMQRENQEHAEAELNKALRELADAKTVVAGLAQVSEMAHKENAALKRTNRTHELWAMEVQARAAQCEELLELSQRELSDAKTVVAGLAQVSEMAHKENAALKRTNRTHELWAMEVQARAAQCEELLELSQRELSDAKTVVAGLAQVSEMAHKENAELKRTRRTRS